MAAAYRLFLQTILQADNFAHERSPQVKPGSNESRDCVQKYCTFGLCGERSCAKLYSCQVDLSDRSPLILVPKHVFGTILVPFWYQKRLCLDQIWSKNSPAMLLFGWIIAQSNITSNSNFKPQFWTLCDLICEASLRTLGWLSVIPGYPS